MEPASPITRRSLLQGSAAAAGAMLTGVYPSRAAAEANPAPGNKPLVIDCHAHLHHHSSADYQERDRKLIEAADKLGIDQLCCSILTPQPSGHARRAFGSATPGWPRRCKRFRGRVLGYCYVNPGCGRRRWTRSAAVSRIADSWASSSTTSTVCTDPVVFPVVELAIELRVPILHHAGHGHHPDPNQPNISDGGDLAELGTALSRGPARSAPTSAAAAIGSGRSRPCATRDNVFLDTSGSVTDEGIVDMAVEILGVDRVLFGCDMSMTAGVGKIRGADSAQTTSRRSSAAT